MEIAGKPERVFVVKEINPCLIGGSGNKHQPILSFSSTYKKL
jgi:hypothetical protein